MFFFPIVAVQVIYGQGFNTRTSLTDDSYSITACTFTDCSSSLNGGALYFNCPGEDLCITKCIFTNCATDATEGLGACVYFVGTSLYGLQLKFAECTCHASYTYECRCSSQCETNCTTDLSCSGNGRDYFVYMGTSVQSSCNSTLLHSASGAGIRMDFCPSILHKFHCMTNCTATTFYYFESIDTYEARFVCLDGAQPSSTAAGVCCFRNLQTITYHQFYVTNCNVPNFFYDADFTTGYIYDSCIEFDSIGSKFVKYNCSLGTVCPLPSLEFDCDSNTATFTAGRLLHRLPVVIAFGMVLQ